MSSLKVGIVGFPNVGKSTLFNALLKKRVALSANYPFATIDPNVGVAAVPDPRLSNLAELVKEEEKMIEPPPIIPASVEFVDIAGLVKGASSGAGLGNQFLSHIREVDAIIHVLRDFSDPNIIREGSVSPQADKLIIEAELALSDLQVLEKLITNQEKVAKMGKDLIDYKKLEILNLIKKNLDEGKILGRYEMADAKLNSWFKTLPLLTTKQMLYVSNVSEQDFVKRVKAQEADEKGASERTIMICAKLEEELADYTDAERQEYLETLGTLQTGLERLVKKAYEILDLMSYLTAGKKEVRAWTITKGTKAPQAAGVIHTDFEKNFIRAQVTSYEKLIEAGSFAEAKKLGWTRIEGKDYIMQDGDVVEFLVGS